MEYFNLKQGKKLACSQSVCANLMVFDLRKNWVFFVKSIRSELK